VPEEVILQELITQNRLLQAENEQLKQEIKLLKQKVDLLIRRLFGSKSEKLDPAQLELLLKDLDLGKAIASAEKAEACTSPKKTDTEIWLTVKVCGLIRTLHFVQGRNPA
jgi:hypothetical protein